jgi:hypothetical protein
MLSPGNDLAKCASVHERERMIPSGHEWMGVRGDGDLPRGMSERRGQARRLRHDAERIDDHDAWTRSDDRKAR